MHHVLACCRMTVYCPWASECASPEHPADKAGPFKFEQLIWPDLKAAGLELYTAGQAPCCTFVYTQAYCVPCFCCSAGRGDTQRFTARCTTRAGAWLHGLHGLRGLLLLLLAAAAICTLCFVPCVELDMCCMQHAVLYLQQAPAATLDANWKVDLRCSRQHRRSSNA